MLTLFIACLTTIVAVIRMSCGANQECVLYLILGVLLLILAEVEKMNAKR